MINPEKITNYDLDDRGLEEFILFWVCAAGKNGRTAARCLDKFLCNTNSIDNPFKGIREWSTRHGNIPEMMKGAGIGCYYAKASTFIELVLSNLNLITCTASDLESIYGIGCKTSRCFILHSRSNAQVAGLDTHMLKHLRASGYDDVPKSTPTGNKYLTNEKRVLSLAKEAGMAPSEFDLWVWNKYSVKSKAQ